MTRGFMGGVLLLVLVALSSDARAWGPRGHVLVTRGAVSAAAELPPWFRDAQRALVELSIAADRWKELEDEVRQFENKMGMFNFKSASGEAMKKELEKKMDGTRREIERLRAQHKQLQQELR